MPNKIVIDSSDLQQCVARYTSALATLRDAHASYTRSLEDLRSDWTGRAFVIMSGKVAAMGINIAKSFDKLTDAISELNEMNELAQDTENDIKGKIAAYDVGSESPFNAG